MSGLPEGGSRFIRPAEPGDAAAIRAIHLAAFPTAAEADLVERVERDRDAIVSLVAEQEGESVGHALLSRMRVTGDGRSYRALGLGPIGVLPPFQRGGVGAELIRGGLAIAGLVATGTALALLDGLLGTAWWADLLLIAGVTGAVGLARFVALRVWVFPGHPHPAAEPA